ncbi:MAG: hypothetical protein ACLFUF_07065 [Opitutales bacterium]
MAIEFRVVLRLNPKLDVACSGPSPYCSEQAGLFLGMKMQLCARLRDAWLVKNEPSDYYEAKF